MSRQVPIDGDGSILWNMASLATIGNNARNNFILLIIDNGSYGSTGDQPTYAGQKTSPAAVARACGCEKVIKCEAAETADILSNAIDAMETTVIVGKCESGNVEVPVIDMNPIMMRERFIATVQE